VPSFKGQKNGSDNSGKIEFTQPSAPDRRLGARAESGSAWEGEPSQRSAGAIRQFPRVSNIDHPLGDRGGKLSLSAGITVDRKLQVAAMPSVARELPLE
jgi:hypothetical protein